MKSIVVIYATREGQTQKVAERVVADLCKSGLEAYAQNVNRDAASIHLGSHSAVVVAASVHMGRHEREMVKFVREHRDELDRLPSVFLSVNLSEAIVERPGIPQETRAKSEADVNGTIDKFIQQTGWRPKQTKAVAGALAFTKYGPITKFLMKRAALAGERDTTRDYEYTNWVDLDRFAEEFAQNVVKSAVTVPQGNL